VGDSNTVALSGNEDDSKAKADKTRYEQYYKIGASSAAILQYVENAIDKKPPFISILAGTNDVDGGENPMENIRKMISLCREKNIPVFL
jgi:lysophospholipase L1-like esterase